MKDIIISIAIIIAFVSCNSSDPKTKCHSDAQSGDFCCWNDGGADAVPFSPFNDFLGSWVSIYAANDTLELLPDSTWRIVFRDSLYYGTAEGTLVVGSTQVRNGLAGNPISIRYRSMEWEYVDGRSKATGELDSIQEADAFRNAAKGHLEVLYLSEDKDTLKNYVIDLPPWDGPASLGGSVSCPIGGIIDQYIRIQ